MHIVVCIKQVPDTANLKFDAASGTIQGGTELMMNPFCEYAVETAIRLKEAYEGSKVSVFTLGTPQAKEVLKRAVAMGADEAYLLSDDAFNGADTWATGYTLGQAIQKYAADYNLILCGQLSTDGMNGITGPAMAEFLGIPSLTFGKSVAMKDGQRLTINRETERGIEVCEMTLPGLVCVMKCDYEPRIPSIKGVMKANRTEIPIVTMADLGLSAEKVGYQGSPTTISKSWKKPKKQGGVKIDGSNPDAAVQQLIGFLKEQKVL
jgi:electron transfer flavoprotein alpha/beta subunit